MGVNQKRREKKLREKQNKARKGESNADSINKGQPGYKNLAAAMKVG